MSINYPSSLLPTPTPTTSGSVLTSNGTSWVSAPAQGGGSAIIPTSENVTSYFILNGTGSNGSTDIPNTGIVSASYTLNGGVEISTAQSKWGAGSIYFDATGSYIHVASNSNFAPGTGDFTYELFYYANSITNSGVGNVAGVLFDARYPVGPNTYGFAVYITDTGNIAVVKGGFVLSLATATITTASWQHLALVRKGTTVSVYLTGSLIDTSSANDNLSDGQMYIGTGFDQLADDRGGKFDGYINSYRYSPVARYSGSSFTPPTAAFPAAYTDSNGIGQQLIGNDNKLYVCFNNNPQFWGIVSTTII